MDNIFRRHQEWSVVGLSWQSNAEGRVMEDTITKGKLMNCSEGKDNPAAPYHASRMKLIYVNS